jgi:hypothetical protein
MTITAGSKTRRIVSKMTHLLSQITRLESTLTRRESTRTQLLTAAAIAYPGPAKLSTTPSSEIRFDSLPDRLSAVTAMVQATNEFSIANGVLIHASAANDEFPALAPGAGFRYADQYQPFVEAFSKGEKVTIVTVLQSGEVIAFGIGEVPTNDGVEIMTVDVASASRRSAGVKSTTTIDGESFEIGIGHVLVLGLIESIDAEIVHTNATTAPARYIFKSLGFVSTDEDNSCLLRLEKSDKIQGQSHTSNG